MAIRQNPLITHAAGIVLRIMSDDKKAFAFRHHPPAVFILDEFTSMIYLISNTRTLEGLISDIVSADISSDNKDLLSANVKVAVAQLAEKNLLILE